MHLLRSVSILSLTVVLSIATAQNAEAIVLIDDDFSAAQGYVDGALQFQEPDGSGNGIWLGQLNPNSGNPIVDSTAGTVSVVTGPTNGMAPPLGGDAFLRNAWNLGATGGTLGGGGTEVGSGFSQGDVIQIDFDYQFEIFDPDANHELFQVGVTDCFATCGFQANARAGVEAGFSEFNEGAVKFFTNPFRSSTNGADNTYGLIIPAQSLGLDTGFTSGTPDTISDTFSVSWTAELTDEANDIWTSTELVVTNVDTATEVGRASVDNPLALETFVWNSTSVDDPFTPEVNEGGLAGNPNDDGSEMFAAYQWTKDVTLGGSAAVSSVRFEYIGGTTPPLAGDANGDGVVDLLDLDILGTNFGLTPATFADGDFNGDGVVDLLDLDILGTNFGATSPSASVPEPTALALAMVGLLAAAYRKRA